MCKESNLKCSDPVSASRSRTDLFKHVCDLQVLLSALHPRSHQTLSFFSSFFGLFSTNAAALTQLKLLVGVHVGFGTRTGDSWRSHRICGFVDLQVVRLMLLLTARQKHLYVGLSL